MPWPASITGHQRSRSPLLSIKRLPASTCRSLHDGVQDPTNFYFNVTLSNPTNTVLGSPTNALVNILDAHPHGGQSPGSPDDTFTAGMNGDVLALALQTNGQILAGGNFTYRHGTPENSIARLNADGSLDIAGFLNGYSGANGAVQAIVCQTDDRVLIGGAFTTVDGITRNHIARLMTDGSLDTSFNPGSGADGPVYALAETFVNGVRKIYVGGSFSCISGGHQPQLRALNNDGTLDPSFAAGSGPNGAVFAIAVYPTNSPFCGQGAHWRRVHQRQQFHPESYRAVECGWFRGYQLRLESGGQ